MKTNAILVLVGLTVAIVVAGILVVSQPFAVTKMEYTGHFDSFGDNLGTDNLIEKNPAKFDDEDQTIEGNASAEYSLTQVANESFTGNSASYVNLANDDFEPGSVTVRNATDDTTVSSSEYTMNYTDGGIKVTSTWDTASMKITYNYMPTKRGNVIAEIYFETDGRIRGGTFDFSWPNGNITSDNTIAREADIQSYEDNQIVQELSESKIQNGNQVEVGSLPEGEYIIYLEFDHIGFTPNPSSGTYEEGLNMDFTLNSDAKDEPVEVEGYTIFAKTV